MKTAGYIARFIYLVFGLFFQYMEAAANWLIGYNKKTEYIKKGGCRRCGRCCQVLAVQYPIFFNRLKGLLKLTIKWQEFRYCFTYLNMEDNYLLYKCNLVGPDGLCGQYWLRPRLCREYPKMGLYGRPHTHRSCGYYFIRRDGRPTFDEALHRASDKHSKS